MQKEGFSVATLHGRRVFPCLCPSSPGGQIGLHAHMRQADKKNGCLPVLKLKVEPCGNYDRGQVVYPICSMYGISTYMWVIYGVNIGKYSIHGAWSTWDMHIQELTV